MGWKRVAGTAPAAMVARRIADDPTVPPDVRAAVLDALGATDPPPEPAVGGLSDVFLRAIRVRGFRGIGAETELALRPGPGLTLVVGRNGCGKSSFAEAAELALTGGNRRWDGRSAAWREGWRNLHDGANPRIELELLTGAAESAPVVVKEWTARAELHEARWVMRGADGDPAEFDADGWAPVLELYRPFLSYSELGALVDGKPSDLFDALHQLLGLDDLIAAHTRLRGRRLEQERAVKQCRQQRLELRTDLAAVADDRAARLLALLDTERPDLAAVDREVRGGAPGADGAADLRAIVALTVPSAAAV
ncbi:AAA family ATPase, partial [Nocardia farcinica]